MEKTSSEQGIDVIKGIVTLVIMIWLNAWLMEIIPSHWSRVPLGFTFVIGYCMSAVYIVGSLAGGMDAYEKELAKEERNKWKK